MGRGFLKMMKKEVQTLKTGKYSNKFVWLFVFIFWILIHFLGFLPS